MTPRDLRFDPQTGDEVRNGDIIRRVIERAGEMLLVEGWGQRYWIKVRTWQRWCEHSGAKAVVMVTRQE